ncbi:MAG: hypothetical protein EA424_12275 [Planctomycetaceae bacterium]|nr:MAG: hypothetical protein EA424_12275 [Planctomycetaceae bacterium]
MSMRTAVVFGAVMATLIICPPNAAPSEDGWPMYRYDARRSGFSPQGLPAVLELHWQRQLPGYEVAFPNEARKQFDSSYEPVCADGVLVVASPADGSVRAYAVETGEERWRFYAEGPVRLAPVLHEGRVLFGADDGRFRCLDLKSGDLLWEHRAYLPDAPDARLLGNNRLISHWPVRGGAVVKDQTVYFASGVWPTMGVFVWALDIRTGTPHWMNASLGHIKGVRIDHDVRHDSGISPQGYLLATEDRLIVPSGRSLPLGLNRSDGSLFHYVMGYRSGDWRVVVGGDYLLVGQTGVLSLADFREVGNTFQTAGTADPQAVETRRDLTESPRAPYKFFAGADADSIIDGAMAYSFVDGVFLAHDLDRSGVSEHGTSPLQPVSSVLRWDAQMTMRVPTGLGGHTRLFARAGDTFYGRAGDSIVALKLTHDTPAVQVAWKHEVASRPTSVIPAEGRLFAVLEDGMLLCFGEEGTHGEIQATKADIATVSPSASESLQAVDFPNDGFFIALGGLSPAETEHLVQKTDLRMIVVSADDDMHDSERRRLAATGTYGSRVERFAGDPLAFHLPHYIASLLWWRGDVLEPPTAAQLRRAWDAVRPFGGRLRFTGTEAQTTRFAELANTAELSGAEIAVDDRGVTLLRLGGPEGAADWTHETADAARSFFSQDTAVRPPLTPLWFGDGPGYGFIKHKDYGIGVKPQVVEGRVVALQQHTQTLFAYDAYTGRVLWRTRGEGDDAGFITRHVVLCDGVYAAGNGLCVVFDPDTGDVLRRMQYATGENEPTRASGIVVSDDSILIAASVFEGVRAIEQGLWDAEVLICLDRKTGKHRWSRQSDQRFNIKALAIGDGKVFATDSMSPLAIDRWQRRGGDLNECSSLVIALDEASGQQLWSYQYTAAYRQHGASGWTTVRGTDDWLGYVQASGRLLVGRAGSTALLDGDHGHPVWEKSLALVQPVVILGDRMIDQRARLFDIASGEQTGSGFFQRGGCNYAVANQFLTFQRDRTISYADLETGEQSFLRNIRSGCSNSLVAASGILSIPQYTEHCVCNYPIQTTTAWIHDPEAADWGPQDTVTLEPVAIEILPRLTPDEASRMHHFERRFVVNDAEQAAAHLIAHWDFEGLEDGALVATDRSGHGADSRLANARFTEYGDRRALSCGGDEPKTVARATLEPRGLVRDAVTIAAWVRLDESQHYTHGNSGIVESPQHYRLMVRENQPPYTLSFDVRTEDGSWRSARTPSGAVEADRWVHVAGTYDGETGEIAFFLNGEQVAHNIQRPGRIHPGGDTIAIGLRDGVAYLSGAVADIRIYDRALGPDAQPWRP